MSNTLRFLVFAAIIALPATLQAALQWDTLSYKIKASPTDVSASAVFPFENRGDGKVVIDEIKSGCGCTTAELAKREYERGEKGEIKVTFSFGDRVGEQHKTVSVRYSEGGESTTVVLELFVDIPETVAVNPCVQYWNRSDKPDARPVVITITQGYEGKPVKAVLYTEPDHSNFTVSAIEKVSDGKYIFSITPKSTAEVLSEAGEIVIEIPGCEPKKMRFFAVVRQ